MSDVYSFGVVLLELLTGRRSLERNRPAREQNLVEWARPMLNDERKLCRIMDTRLEGQFSEIGARKAAALAYQCLSRRPKQRPTMSEVVKTLELLKDYPDMPIGTFVFVVPETTTTAIPASKGNETPKDDQKRQNYQLRNPRSPISENGARNDNRRTMSSPLHPRGGGRGRRQ